MQKNGPIPCEDDDINIVYEETNSSLIFKCSNSSHKLQPRKNGQNHTLNLCNNWMMYENLHNIERNKIRKSQDIKEIIGLKLATAHTMDKEDWTTLILKE